MNYQQKLKTRDGLYGSIETAREVGISLRQLYHWVDDLHVVEPQIVQHGLRQFRRFSPHDVKVLKQMRDLVEWGYTLQAAAGVAKDNEIQTRR